MRAIGYHGTSDAAARRILSSGFEISRNDYDWLGDGAYFFQDAQPRALQWARERFGAEGVVIGAEIDLEGCLDLLDAQSHALVRDSHADLVRRLHLAGVPLPRQTRGAHRLDRAVINHAAGLLQSRGFTVRTVRAAFIEDEPVRGLRVVERGAPSDRGS
jgi:hypothetical protein